MGVGLGIASTRLFSADSWVPSFVFFFFFLGEAPLQERQMIIATSLVWMCHISTIWDELPYLSASKVALSFGLPSLHVYQLCPYPLQTSHICCPFLRVVLVVLSAHPLNLWFFHLPAVDFRSGGCIKKPWSDCYHWALSVRAGIRFSYLLYNMSQRNSPKADPS
jgi:hypothetical protein